MRRTPKFVFAEDSAKLRRLHRQPVQNRAASDCARQVLKFAKSLMRGEPNRGEIALSQFQGRVGELV